MVGADHLVPVSDIGFLAQEQSAVIGQPSEEPTGIAGQHLHMLRSDTIRLRHQFFICVAQDDLTMIAPGHAGDVGGGQNPELPVDLRLDFPSDFPRCRQQNRRRRRSMLGLPQQIRGAHFGVGGVVGDDQRFGRAREQIDANPAEQLPFCFRDESIAGSHQHIHRGDGLRAQPHCRDRLNAAQQINFVGTAQRHRGDGGGGRNAVQRRGAGGDARNAGNLGRQNRHMRRGHHRVPPAGHVTTHAGNRNVFVTQPNAGQRFHFDIDQGGPLRLGEAADLRLGEFNVVDDLPRQAVHQGRNFIRAQPERFRLPFVEPGGQFAHRRVAALRNIVEYRFHRSADLAVGRLLLRFRRALFQYPYHGTITPPSSRRRQPARSP